ncbi:hypothetical protein IAD21_02420 [Abditibacteriota bacterium]|nr:hypothetical protein IAD21_02420 [Abditibacteriota bacterium]
MGNEWSGPHPWPSERKTYVEACWKAPGRVCPKCGRAVRYLYVPFKYPPLKFAPIITQGVPEPKLEEWACRVCHDLVYASQYPNVWENDHKRTLEDFIARCRKDNEQMEKQAARLATRSWKSWEKAQKQRARYLRQQEKASGAR